MFCSESNGQTGNSNLVNDFSKDNKKLDKLMILLFNVLCITKRIPRTRSSENYCYAIVSPIRTPSLAIFVITLPFSPPPLAHNKANFYRLQNLTAVPFADSILIRHITKSQVLQSSLLFFIFGSHHTEQI